MASPVQSWSTPLPSMRLTTGSDAPAEEVVEGRRRAGLGVVQQVGVGVQGDLGAGVAEALLDDLDRLAGLEEQGGVGVAQLVHGETGAGPVGVRCR